MKQLLGTGLLSWPGHERRSGRYGIIALFRSERYEDIAIDWAIPVRDLVGKRGTLIAVLDDKEYVLGSGTFFTEQAYETNYIGVKPDIPRNGEWLNVKNLYAVDGMLINKPVELYFKAEATIDPDKLREHIHRIENRIRDAINILAPIDKNTMLTLAGVDLEEAMESVLEIREMLPEE